MFVTLCSPGSGCSGVNLCDDCSSGLRSSLRLYRVMRDVSTAAGRPRELNELIDQLRPAAGRIYSAYAAGGRATVLLQLISRKYKSRSRNELQRYNATGGR